MEIDLRLRLNISDDRVRVMFANYAVNHPGMYPDKKSVHEMVGEAGKFTLSQILRKHFEGDLNIDFVGLFDMDDKCDAINNVSSDQGRDNKADNMTAPNWKKKNAWDLRDAFCQGDGELGEMAVFDDWDIEIQERWLRVVDVADGLK
jgi:hypothetical protein